MTNKAKDEKNDSGCSAPPTGDVLEAITKQVEQLMLNCNQAADAMTALEECLGKAVKVLSQKIEGANELTMSLAEQTVDRLTKQDDEVARLTCKIDAMTERMSNELNKD